MPGKRFMQCVEEWLEYGDDREYFCPLYESTLLKYSQYPCEICGHFFPRAGRGKACPCVNAGYSKGYVVRKVKRLLKQWKEQQ